MRIFIRGSFLISFDFYCAQFEDKPKYINSKFLEMSIMDILRLVMCHPSFITSELKKVVKIDE